MRGLRFWSASGKTLQRFSRLSPFTQSKLSLPSSNLHVYNTRTIHIPSITSFNGFDNSNSNSINSGLWKLLLGIGSSFVVLSALSKNKLYAENVWQDSFEDSTGNSDQDENGSDQIDISRIPAVDFVHLEDKSSAELPAKARLKKKKPTLDPPPTPTEKENQLLHIELLKLQDWVKEHKQRVLIIVEGRDTAGKGSAIRFFTQHLNPRYYRVISFRKPAEEEKGDWYWRRYIKQLPNPGEIVFFARSWYSRAYVEPAMDYCAEEQYQQFMREVTPIEQMISEDGIIIIKFWLSITKEVQEQRLREPTQNPLRRWKMKPTDWKVLVSFEVISKFRDEMFAKTSTDTNPWAIVLATNKSEARREAVRHILDRVPYSGKNKEMRLEPDPNVVRVYEPRHFSNRSIDFETERVRRRKRAATRAKQQQQAKEQAQQEEHEAREQARQEEKDSDS